MVLYACKGLSLHTCVCTKYSNDKEMTDIAGTARGGIAESEETMEKCCLGDMLTDELVSASRCLVLYVTEAGDYRSLVIGDVSTQFSLEHQLTSKWEAADPRLKHKSTSFEPKYRCLNCSYTTNYLHNMRGHHLAAHPALCALPSEEKWTSHFNLLSKRTQDEHNTYLDGSHIVNNSRAKLMQAYECTYCNYKSMYTKNLRDHTAAMHKEALESKVIPSLNPMVVDDCIHPSEDLALPDHVSSIVTRSKVQNESAYPASSVKTEDQGRPNMNSGGAGPSNRRLSQLDSSLDLSDLACVDHDISEGNSRFDSSQPTSTSRKSFGVCDSTSEKGLHSQHVLADHAGNAASDNLALDWRAREALRCEICGEMFDHKKLKEIHMQAYHIRDGYLRCSYCNNDISSTLWAQHQKLHSRAALAAVTCDLCKKSFKSARNLRDHRAEVHKEGVTYTCTECSKAFARERSLKNHITWHKGNKTHICEFCGEGYSLKPSLVKHINSKHAQRSAIKDMNRLKPTLNRKETGIRAVQHKQKALPPPQTDQSDNCVFNPPLSVAEVTVQSAEETVQSASQTGVPDEAKPLTKRPSLAALSTFKRARVEQGEDFICEHCPQQHFISKQSLMSHTLDEHGADEDVHEVPPLSARGVKLQSQFSNTPHSQLSEDLIEAAYLYNTNAAGGDNNGQRQTLLLAQRSGDKEDR